MDNVYRAWPEIRERGRRGPGGRTGWRGLECFKFQVSDLSVTLRIYVCIEMLTVIVEIGRAPTYIWWQRWDFKIEMDGFRARASESDPIMLKQDPGLDSMIDTANSV